MAVQAQYPSNVLLFNRNVQEGKIILGNNDYSMQPQPMGSFLDQSHMNFINNGVGVNPRKRSREVSEQATPTTTTNMNSFSFSLQNQHLHHHHHHHQQQNHNQNQNHQLIDLSQLQNHNQQSPNVVSTGLRLSFGDQIQQHQQQQQQQIQQHQPTLFSLLSEDLALQSKQQTDELNYFLHAQGEQLRRTLAEKRQRHYRALILAAEEAMARRMREKEAEVEKAALRNAELEAKAAQFCLEAQSWRAKAQAQEAQTAQLQAQLQHAISVVGPSCGAHQQKREREVDGVGCTGEVEDNESAYVDPVSERRVNSPSCKVCQKRVASVVLLPCRHLCVCRDCDDVVQACPLCLSLRTAGVEVYLT